MHGPLLQVAHLPFEAEEDDHGHTQRQPQDEKGQDDHHRAVGQAKGRMHMVDHGDDRGQDGAESGDALVDVGVAENHPFQAIGEGHEQGDIKEHAEQDVLLGLFHVVVDPGGQGPAGPGGGHEGIVGLPGQGLFGGVELGHARLFQLPDALVENAVLFQVLDARGQEIPHVPGGGHLRDRQDGPLVHGIARAQWIVRRGVEKDHLAGQNRVRQDELVRRPGFQKQGQQRGIQGIQAAEPGTHGRGLAAAVEKLDLGEITEGARVQGREKRALVAAEHDQIGLHDVPGHLDPVGVLSGLFLVHGPYGLARVRIEAEALDDGLVQDVFAAGEAVDPENALGVGHGVEAGLALVDQKDRARGRTFGKKFPLADEVGPAGERGQHVAGASVTDIKGLGAHIGHKPGGEPALPGKKREIHKLGNVVGGAPQPPGVVDRGQGQAQDARDGADLATELGLVREITLPGLQAALPQGVAVKGLS
ncbi:hypothetical protein ASZ90_000277 [hydrocarbon metagenome]|uniref:Uncharacterized protein n=1 Tax=hydrocarbon metagenome TaxID=938273 RepID=A0A0W8G9V4_9ZZZZ